MAAMTSADVAYSQLAQFSVGNGRVKRAFALTFPTGAVNNQYPTGGIPLLPASLGCPKQLVSLKVVGRTPAGAALNPVYEWNGSQTAPTLVSFETGAALDTPLDEQDATVAYAANSQVVYVEVEGY